MSIKTMITDLRFVDKGSRKMLQMRTIVMREQRMPTISDGAATALVPDGPESDWLDVPLVDDADTEKHKPLQGH